MEETEISGTRHIAVPMSVASQLKSAAIVLFSSKSLLPLPYPGPLRVGVLKLGWATRRFTSTESMSVQTLFSVLVSHGHYLLYGYG